MRILLACPYDLTYLGGVTSHILDLAYQFKRHGHDVTIAGAQGSGDVRREGIEKLGGSVRFALPGDAARVNLNPWVHNSVKRLLSRRDFDVFHLHEPFLGYIGASFMRYGAGLKIGTFHTWREGVHWPYTVFNPIVRNWNRLLDGRIAVSESAAATVRRYVPAEYRVIPNGIYVDDFAEPVPPPKHLQDERPTILFVGRLELRKGVHVLLDAFARLKPRLPYARLVIVGEGSMKQTWMRRAQALGLDEDVRFEGYVPRESLRAYYHRADIFCSPSIENESFGITLLEAMASGTPVIATRNNGSSTVGEDGLTGTIVEPGDAAALGDALEALLEDPMGAERMAQAARARAQQFDWSVVTASILDYYGEVARVPVTGSVLRSPV